MVEGPGSTFHFASQVGPVCLSIVGVLVGETLQLRKDLDSRGIDVCI